MKITSETYKAYAAPACVATITLISGIPRMVSEFYPGATSRGILISGLTSSVITFFFTAAPEFQHRRDLGLSLSITSIFTFTIGIPFLSKAYEKAMRKTEIVMDGYFRFGVACYLGMMTVEAIGKTKIYPEKPKPPEQPTPTPQPSPKPIYKPKPKTKPKPVPGYIHIFPPPKDPPPYSPPRRDPWARFDEMAAEEERRLEEYRRNPPPFDIPGTPPKHTYTPPHMWGSTTDEQPISNSWVHLNSDP
ncbi:MAG: hypothetical protein KDK69_01600 [Chlamydiia bacterium]|nr:hypothetical protein [Chlamydiia bacterium]